MENILNLKGSRSGWLPVLAKTGLFAKGAVYSLMGLLAVMAAFHISGQRSKNTDKQGVFNFVRELPAGDILLLIIAIGLVCYTLWRFLQVFLDTENKGKDAKGLGNRFRYFSSGLIYLSVSAFAIKMLMGKQSGSGQGEKQDLVQQLLEKPAGQWLVGIVAVILAVVGVYQIYYGLSEKYKKHVGSQDLNSKARSGLLLAGKVGYVSRGIVWLIIAFFFTKAALHSNSKEAGDTGQAFSFVEHLSYGNYLLAILGTGLICYGVFNFVRAAVERIKT